MSILDHISLFGLSIMNKTRSSAIEILLQKDGVKRTAAFVNAHCINVAKEDSSYMAALKKADYILPDGSGLQIAARMQGERFVENLNGTDLFIPLCQEAARRCMPVFLFGSQEGVATAAAEKAKELASGLQIAGTRNGFFSSEEVDDIIQTINESGADIVLVALGVPLQDVWIAQNRHRLNAQIVLGVGAQFDFWSGRIARAPWLLRKMGLEWCWRLLLEPKRLAKRYLIGNPRFLLHAFKERPMEEKPKLDGKRLLDLIVSGSAIIALAPIMAAIALAVRVTSSGPALFKQERVGRNGKTFSLYKFRSMYKDAEARRAALLASSDRDGICFKSKTDVRITHVGRWLRRFSLDELPQLFNVWQGDMSIVGPRPALPEEVKAYPSHALQRLEQKPGITGLWQVSGRAEIDFDRMVEMDNAYVKSRSLALDILLLLLTLRAVIGGRGAY